MKRSPIQEITSSNQKISYGMLGWVLCLLGLLLGGAMASMLSVLDETMAVVGKSYMVFGMGITVIGGIICCVFVRIFRKKNTGSESIVCSSLGDSGTVDHVDTDRYPDGSSCLDQ